MGNFRNIRIQKFGDYQRYIELQKQRPKYYSSWH